MPQCLFNCISFASMNKQRYSDSINDCTGRFKNWSRKGYAVFSSLSAVVHIGCLSVTLVQWIGQLLGHEEVDTLFVQNKMDDTCDEVLEQEEFMLVPIVISTNEGACHKIIRKIY